MLWLLHATLLGAWAADPPAAPAAEVPAAAAAAWRELSAERLTARFEQVQHRSVLAKPLHATGSLAYARPDRVRWTVDAPVRSVFVLDGARASSALPDLGHRETLDLSQQPEAARLVQGLLVWLGGDLARVARDYDVAWQDGPPAVATLTPRDPTLKKLLARIELTVGGAPRQVERVVLHEPSGDYVEITLSDVVVDPVLPPGTFDPP
ncbi:MAG: outer membrane lipoprotein carrier protein LolA [Myxococcota bacterium]